MQGSIGWQSVREEALRRIRNRDWPPGERIPDEAALAAELGCARATVNRALRDLADSGLLERRRRGGTRVPLVPVRKATFSISIIRHDIEARGQQPGYRLLRDTLAKAPDKIATAFDASATEKLRHVQALHLADGAPFCLEDRWLRPSIAGPDLSFETLSPNEWLVRNVPFAQGGFSFLAVPADAQTAGHLECAEGSALLALDRTTFGPSMITAVRLTYAPGFRIEAQL